MLMMRSQMDVTQLAGAELGLATGLCLRPTKKPSSCTARVRATASGLLAAAPRGSKMLHLQRPHFVTPST